MKAYKATGLLLPLVFAAFLVSAESRVVNLQAVDGINLKASYTSVSYTHLTLPTNREV